jgi:hypothetical protein
MVTESTNEELVATVRTGLEVETSEYEEQEIGLNALDILAARLEAAERWNRRLLDSIERHDWDAQYGPDSWATEMREAKQAAEREVARLRAAASAYLTLTTYDQDPRTWNAAVFAACEELSAALAEEK